MSRPAKIVHSGRPLSITDEVVKKLESILKIGGTIEEACSYSLISKPTYYAKLNSDEDFFTRMEASKYYADIKAKNLVVDAIVEDKDLATAKWWLEKRQFKEGPVVATQVNIGGDMSLEFITDASKTT